MEGEKINILNPQYMDINFSLGTLKQPLSSWFSFLFKHIKRIVKLKHTTHEHFLTLLHLHRTELVHDGEYQPLLLSSDRYPSNSAQPAWGTLAVLSQGPLFASDVAVNITVITEQGHQFLMDNQRVELANLLFLAFSPLCIYCWIWKILPLCFTYHGLSQRIVFCFFPPYLLLRTGLCFICSVLPSLLHLSNAHLANSQLSSSPDLILKQETKAKERKSCTRY